MAPWLSVRHWRVERRAHSAPRCRRRSSTATLTVPVPGGICSSQVLGLRTGRKPRTSRVHGRVSADTPPTTTTCSCGHGIYANIGTRRPCRYDHVCPSLPQSVRKAREAVMGRRAEHLVRRPIGGPVRQGLGPVGAVPGAVGVVELDLLLADLAADGLLLGDRLGAQFHPLHGDGLGRDHGALGVQCDLVLLLRDRGAVVGVAAVGLGDRLALQGDFLVRHRHRDLLVLGDHVLAQPGPPGLAGLGADAELLLRAGHCGVGGGAGGVAALRTGRVGQAAALAGLRVDRGGWEAGGEAVVAVELVSSDALIAMSGSWCGAACSACLSKGTVSVSPSQSDCASGTSETWPPNSPLLTAAHSGASVALSR